MKPDKQLDTLEDLLEYLIAEGETVVLQKAWQIMEEGEGFDLNGLVMSLAGKEKKDETG